MEGKRFSEAVIETRACAVGSKRSYLLLTQPAIQPTEENFGVEHFTVRGTMLAYATAYYGGSRYTEDEESHEEWRLVVRDLRSGRIVHDVPSGPNYPAHPLFVGDGWIVSIVLKADGAVAWATEAPYTTWDFAIHALDAGGVRELAVGHPVRPRSLALTGSLIDWTEGGLRKSAPLN